MAYTKTDWVNGSAPFLNATNLDKIEQGIQDAHNLGGVPGPRLAFLGDSITDFAEPYPYYAPLLSGGQLILHQRSFLPGATSTVILADYLPAIVDAAPQDKADACVVLWGHNDAQTTTALSTFQANTQDAVEALREAGIVPVLATTCPLNNDTHAVYGGRYNAWLKRYAATEKIVLIDFHRALVDQTTGNWKTAYDFGDGIHPNAAGTRRMGLEVANVLSPLVPPQPLPVQAYPTADNLLTNTNFIADTNADGIPNGYWTSSTNFAAALVADPEGHNRLRMTVSGATEGQTVSSDEIGAGWTAGDELFYAVRVTSEQSGTDTGLKTQVTFYTSGYSVVQNTILPLPTINGTTQAVDDGIAQGRMTCPAGGADRMIVSFVVGPGAGVYHFAQPTLLNLTANG